MKDGESSEKKMKLGKHMYSFFFKQKSVFCLFVLFVLIYITVRATQKSFHKLILKLTIILNYFRGYANTQIFNQMSILQSPMFGQRRCTFITSSLVWGK